METDSYHFVYRHWRGMKGRGGLHLFLRGITDWEPALKGGATECWVYNADGECVAYGGAECSLKDSYVYRIGRDIARGRALKSLQKGLTN